MNELSPSSPANSETPAASGPQNGTGSAHGEHAHSQAGFWGLALGSLGVVYGDIGTSPLYAFREAILAGMGHGSTGAPSRDVVMSVLSLILWALILVVTVKYVILLLRADNRGEGGILTLVALANKALGNNVYIVALLGIIGAALFYGDAAITPAISVLSAVEGLKLVTPVLDPYILPITCFILVSLFAVQSRGTASVAVFFGPITLVWFAVLAITGAIHIADDLSVFQAFNPLLGASFVYSHPHIGLMTIGAVFLAVTGGEALYADLGHFGRRPIQYAWLGVVFPALTLNYLGQGAMVLKAPETLESPFYLLAPDWALIPMVILATLATIIASQAVMTGAYSLTRQAIQLGLLPRMRVDHTSEEHSGQIYMPGVNWSLLIAVLVLVLSFRSSSALAAAYGIAVTTTMTVTGVLTFIVIHRLWGWSVALSALIMTPIIALDLTFFGSNLLKLHDGGWVPLAFGIVMMTLMLTWRKGSRILAEKTRRIEVPLKDLIASLEKRPPHKVPGTAIFLTASHEHAPTALLHNLKHNKVLHEQNVLLKIASENTPIVEDSARVSMEKVSDSFSLVVIRFGYMESPNVPKALGLCRKMGWKFDIMSTSFFLSRRHLKASGKMGMPMWQDHIFITLALNANSASDYFHLPTGRVVEVGTQVTV